MPPTSVFYDQETPNFAWESAKVSKHKEGRQFSRKALLMALSVSTAK